MPTAVAEFWMPLQLGDPRKVERSAHGTHGLKSNGSSTATRRLSYPGYTSETCTQARLNR